MSDCPMSRGDVIRTEKRATRPGGATDFTGVGSVMRSARSACKTILRPLCHKGSNTQTSGELRRACECWILVYSSVTSDSRRAVHNSFSISQSSPHTELKLDVRHMLDADSRLKGLLVQGPVLPGRQWSRPNVRCVVCSLVALASPSVCWLAVLLAGFEHVSDARRQRELLVRIIETTRDISTSRYA